MPFDRKYGRVTLEHGEYIPDDEPVVVFRAHDKLLPKVLAYYRLFCWKTGSPRRHLNIIDSVIEDVQQYQREHEPSIPTSETSRAWMDGED